MEGSVVEVSSQSSAGDCVVVVTSPTAAVDKKSARKPYTTKKRRIRSLALGDSSFQDRSVIVDRCRREIGDLCVFFREHLVPRLQVAGDDAGGTRHDVSIACLMEGSALPLAELAAEISNAVEGVTIQSLLTDLPFIGSKNKYGCGGEGEGEGEVDRYLHCIWCWEAREVSLFPKSQRGLVKFLRATRKKVQARIAALSVTIDAISSCGSSEEYDSILLKATERLWQESSLDNLRASVERFQKKISAPKEAKSHEGLQCKNGENGEMNMELEILKKNALHCQEKELEPLNNEGKIEARKPEKEERKMNKLIKRQQEEAQKEEWRREKEEMDLKKRLKRQQDEAEREQKRRQKEKTESRKQASIRKQATLMERFLKLNTNDTGLSIKTPAPQSTKENVDAFDNITSSMDSAFSDQPVHSIDNLLKFHLSAWHKLGPSNKSKHWGTRSNPRKDLPKETQLRGPMSVISSSDKESTKERSFSLEKPINSCLIKKSDDLDEITSDIPGPSDTVILHRNSLKSKRIMKLLQFARSPRPAYYGTWSKKSTVIGPRHPLRKDPELDYDVESDEEWEEEEPGESLTDCEKDEDELEECDDAKGESKEESEDDCFFVPDGYLSEDEGVEMDVSTSDETKGDASSQPEIENEEFRLRLQRAKHLNSLTEKALSKNQPLIISNLMHEKSNLLGMEDLNGLAKVESTCLQALCMQLCPGGSVIDFSSDVPLDTDEDLCQSRCKADASPAAVVPSIPESNLPEIVRSIQSCPQSMSKVVEILHQKFPTFSKKQIKNKVREVAEFVENRWKVKKEVLASLGLSPSPDKSKKPKGITTFFSKRCLPPPSGGDVGTADSSPVQKKSRIFSATAIMEESPAI